MNRLFIILIIACTGIFFQSCQDEEIKDERAPVEIRSTNNDPTNNTNEAQFFDVTFVSDYLKIDSLQQGISSNLRGVLDRMYTDKDRTELVSPLIKNNQYPCWNCAEIEYSDVISYYIPVYDLDDDQLTAMLWGRLEEGGPNVYYLGVDYIESLSRTNKKIYRYWSNLNTYFRKVGDNEDPRRNDFFFSKTLECKLKSPQQCYCGIYKCETFLHTFPATCGEDCKKENTSSGDDGSGNEEEDPPGGGSDTPDEDPYDEDDGPDIPDGPGSCYFCDYGIGGTTQADGGGGPCTNCTGYSVDERQTMVSYILDYIDDNFPSVYVYYITVLVLENNSQFDHTTAVLADHITSMDQAEIEAYLNFIKNHPQFLDDESETLELLYDSELTELLDDFLPPVGEDDYITESVGHIILEIVEAGNISISLPQLFANAKEFVNLMEDHPLTLNNQEVAYLLNHGSEIQDIRTIHEQNPDGTYAEAASNLYVALAALDMLDMTLDEVQSNLDLQDLVTSHLNNHQLSDRLVISASSWFMMFQREANANGGNPIDWLRAKVTALRDAYLDIFKPLVDTHTATLEAAAADLGIPITPEEWKALMAVFGPMLLDLGVDIGTDFLPIEGEYKAFTKTASEFEAGNYGNALFEFIGGVAGILPVGDLLNGSLKTIKAAGSIFLAFKVIKSLSKVSGNIYEKLIEFAQQGWNIAWDNGLKKLIFKNGDEVAGALSNKSKNLADPLDTSYPDGKFEVPSTTINKADGWALKKGDDIAASQGTVPTGQNQAYIGVKNIANNGHRIKVENPGAIKNKVDDIVANGDQFGKKTEELSTGILEKVYPNGTVYGPPNVNIHYSGNKGFDNIVVMPDGSVIINEAKQMSANGSMTLGTGFNFPQMSDGWIDGVIEAMKNSPNESASALYNTLKNAPSITRVVTSVDKTVGEIVITKLNPF